jgi:hypothetical protein
MPSIRELPLAYLEPLGDTPVIVVDDSDGKAPRHERKHITYVDYAFQDRYLPNASKIIPRHNPSCKDFGLLFAYREGYDVVILLDDDCDLRVTPDFLDQVPIHKQVMALPFHSSSGWLNTMLLLTHSDGMWARGYPYEHRHEACTISGGAQSVMPRFNEGLWCGTPDINGIDKLNGLEGVTNPDRRLAHGRVYLGRDQKLPLSIMNVQLDAKLIPAFYQPSDYHMPAGFRVRRHDDVWSMYVLKALMDIRGDVATAGAPMCWHRKEGDMVKEVLSEHYTNLIQPHLTTLIDMVKPYISPGSYGDMAWQLGSLMRDWARYVPGQFQDVLVDYGAKIQAWAEICD